MCSKIVLFGDGAVRVNLVIGIKKKKKKRDKVFFEAVPQPRRGRAAGRPQRVPQYPSGRGARGETNKKKTPTKHDFISVKFRVQLATFLRRDEAPFYKRSFEISVGARKRGVSANRPLDGDPQPLLGTRALTLLFGARAPPATRH